MSDLLEFTAAQAAERIRAGDFSAPELFEAYRERAAGEDLNAFLWVADGPDEAADAGGPLAGVPLAVKDLFCVEGVPSMAASASSTVTAPPYTSTAVRNLRSAGAAVLGKTNMDEFAMGSSNENSGYGPVLNPWDRSRVQGGSSGGSAAAVAAGPRAPGRSAPDHRRLDPPAGLALRDRRAEADLRRRVPLLDDCLRLVARPGRAAHARRHRCRAAAAAHGRARRLRLDVDRLPEEIRIPQRGEPRRHGVRRPARAVR